MKLIIIIMIIIIELWEGASNKPKQEIQRNI